MGNLAMHLFGDSFLNGMGIWLFCSVAAVALFVVFIPMIVWIDGRQKEREAFYRAETFRRLTESSSESARATIEVMREQNRWEQMKAREGMKIGGLITLGVGVALSIFLWSILGARPGSPWLCGLIPAGVGAALLFYSVVLAPPVE